MSGERYGDEADARLTTMEQAITTATRDVAVARTAWYAAQDRDLAVRRALELATGPDLDRLQSAMTGVSRTLGEASMRLETAKQRLSIAQDRYRKVKQQTDALRAYAGRLSTAREQLTAIEQAGQRGRRNPFAAADAAAAITAYAQTLESLYAECDRGAPDMGRLFTETRRVEREIGEWHGRVAA